ncbi:MAG: ABC transporter [Sphingopyxis sp.]|nr:ABC transporter [Sphingopyxis sp.]
MSATVIAGVLLLLEPQPAFQETISPAPLALAETQIGNDDPAGIPAPPAAEPVSPPPVVPTLMPATPETPEQPMDAPSEIVVTAREDAPPEDPLQEVNAEVFRIAQTVDAELVAPIAKGYESAIPEPVRDGVGNALNNLREPVNFLNFLLQFKIGKAAETFGRFAINSTIGVAGLFDVAKKKPFNLPRRPNGFANTLGFYGVKPGPYFFVPVAGSTTLRDAIGDGLDLLLLPIAVGSPFNRPGYSIPTTVVGRLNDRLERDDDIMQLREQSADPYVATRTLYLELREREIEALRHPNRDKADPQGEPAPDLPPQPSSATPPATSAPAAEPPAVVANDPVEPGAL